MIVGMDLVLMTGILGGIFFILNFTTCYSMPWSKCTAPHECRGREKCPEHERKMLCKNHKEIAYLTVITGALHIVLSILYFL